MRGLPNTKKAGFLESITKASIESGEDDLASRCKFNFSYFDVQPAGQDFVVWDHGQLSKLFEKLKHYSAHPLPYWKNQRCGANGTVLAIYGSWPHKSEFARPKHVPHQAQWGRFRLESAVRIVGFVLPSECDGSVHAVTKHRHDCNTFYVVFLDANHRFYITEKK